MHQSDGLGPLGWAVFQSGFGPDSSFRWPASGMPQMERYAALPRPSFSVSALVFFHHRVSHLFTFMFSWMSISMLMVAWVHVCEWSCERDREEGMERLRGAVRFLWNCLCISDEWLNRGGSVSLPPRCADKWAFLKKTGKVEDLPIPAPSKWRFSSAWTQKEPLCGCELGLQALDEESHCVI